MGRLPTASADPLSDRGERERVLLEARKLVWVPGPTGDPTANPALIDVAFPLTRRDWDPNTGACRRNFLVYSQALLADLKAATRRPTNLAKVYDVSQGKECPSGDVHIMIWKNPAAQGRLRLPL